jgi:hypothetical protein
MIATTSVPAIFALSGLALAMVLIAVYMLLIFLMLAIIFWPLIYLAKRIYSLIFSRRYD